MRWRWTERLRARAQTLTADTAALYLAYKRKETPPLAKIIIGVAICYALSPIDLIPDCIPVLGFLDDALLLPLLIAAAIRLLPGDVLRECREQARGLWADGKPRRLRYASPVIVLWLLAAVLAGKALFSA